jgi:hypothetical protein
MVIKAGCQPPGARRSSASILLDRVNSVTHSSANINFVRDEFTKDFFSSSSMVVSAECSITMVFPSAVTELIGPSIQNKVSGLRELVVIVCIRHAELVI